MTTPQSIRTDPTTRHRLAIERVEAARDAVVNAACEFRQSGGRGLGALHDAIDALYRATDGLRTADTAVRLVRKGGRVADTGLHSSRGIPLIWCHRSDTIELPSRPTITVEQWCKWYCLFVVHPDGKVDSLSYTELPGTSHGAYEDHVPVPYAVEVLALERNWAIDPVALEAIRGRWEIEVQDG